MKRKAQGVAQAPSAPPSGEVQAPERPQGGRPLELTVEVIRRAARLLRKGNYLSNTAAILGFDRTTFIKWARRGKSDVAEGRQDTLHAQFFLATTRARARAESACVATITHIAQREPDARVRLDAAKFFLTHSASRTRFSPRQEVTGRNGGPLRTEETSELANLSTEQLQTLREWLLAGKPAKG